MTVKQRVAKENDPPVAGNDNQHRADAGEDHSGRADEQAQLAEQVTERHIEQAPSR